MLPTAGPTHKPAATPATRRQPGVGLLLADPEFGQAIAGEQLDAARRAVVVPRVAVAPGPWSPPDRSAFPAPVSGAVVLEGALMRNAALGGRLSTQLLGPGDVFDPWAATGELLPCDAAWAGHEASTIAVLDARFALAACRWPSLATVVQRRLSARADRLASQVAISQLPTVEQRIVALMWHLAERFGRPSSDGVLVSLRLTHQLIGQLVGARRPTVSLALADLAADGSLRRPDERTWQVSWASQDRLRRHGPSRDAGAV